MQNRRLYYFLGVLAILPSWYFIDVRININNYEKELKKYLVETKKYSDEEISSIKGKHSKTPAYPVYVKFKDEPSVTYVYSHNGEKWIQLGGARDQYGNLPKYKHDEDTNIIE
ncbi:DUF3139 domain-containing protein [Paenibacillus sp. UNC499MF]|uniref:DUF3139 domain-containing protein n=1 Tax=Paenibacillus sp. UNC499MF TaxID=1502751 RepID=UPI00089FED71|nr:DUF3139 domain-containing protein [Paenibacillus sp. UNC499MF]SEG35925.1 Protein of unknown function [Paenibacillus sp. UNC499MF]